MHKFYKILVLLFLSIALNATATPASETDNANFLLNKGHYLKAAKAFQEKSIKTKDLAQSILFNSISEILYSHPDGKYYLSTAFPSGASLLNPDSNYLKPGTIDLRAPLAIQAALRDKAVSQILKASNVIEKSKRLVKVNHESAEQTLETARQHLTQANILSKGIAESYYFDVAKIQVSIHRKRSKLIANQFDLSLAMLDNIDTNSTQYREHLLLLLEKIEDITEELEAIITIADKFEGRFEKISDISRSDYAMLHNIRCTLIEDLKKLDND